MIYSTGKYVTKGLFAKWVVLRKKRFLRAQKCLHHAGGLYSPFSAQMICVEVFDDKSHESCV